MFSVRSKETKIKKKNKNIVKYLEKNDKDEIQYDNLLELTDDLEELKKLIRQEEEVDEQMKMADKRL